MFSGSNHFMITWIPVEYARTGYKISFKECPERFWTVSTVYDNIQDLPDIIKEWKVGGL